MTRAHELEAAIVCPYCHHRTRLVPSKTEDSALCAVPYEGWSANSPSRMYAWIARCACGHFVLVHGMGYGVAPTPRPLPTDDRVPEPIRRTFDQAKMCLSVDCHEAAAVMARRALETACRQLAPSDKPGPLMKLIEQLAEGGIITRRLAAAAHAVRLVGNEGAHPGEVVSREDAESILALTERFLQVFVDDAVTSGLHAARVKS